MQVVTTLQLVHASARFEKRYGINMIYMYLYIKVYYICKEGYKHILSRISS